MNNQNIVYDSSVHSNMNNYYDNNVLSIIFNKSNIIFLIWFLAIYLIIYLIMGIFYSSSGLSNKKLMSARIFDILVFLIILFYIGHRFLYLSDTEKHHWFQENTKDFMYYLNDPLSFFSMSLFIFVFYAIIYVTGIPMTYDEKPISIQFVESISWIVFVLIVIVQFCNFFLEVSIIDLFYKWINHWWNDLDDDYDYKKTEKPVKKDISGNAVVLGNTVLKDQVFNISNNLYTYDDAKAICKSYGSRLATYDDIEKSYNDGGEWCNYGWSENQMIYFPTQKSTWNELQKDPKRKNNCGRPGINGGYIDNPYMRFGVNCYGKKPSPTTADLTLMNSKMNQITPKTPEDELLDKKVKYWKDNASQLLKINSFNNNKWSEY
jgi:hypothetical protein